MSLTDELERFIAQEVDSGRYRTASEVVREAIRLLQAQREEREARLTLLRRAIDEGLDEMERLGAVPAAPVFEKIFSRLREDGDAA